MQNRQLSCRNQKASPEPDLWYVKVTLREDTTGGDLILCGLEDVSPEGPHETYPFQASLTTNINRFEEMMTW